MAMEGACAAVAAIIQSVGASSATVNIDSVSDSAGWNHLRAHVGSVAMKHIQNLEDANNVIDMFTTRFHCAELDLLVGAVKRQLVVHRADFKFWQLRITTTDSKTSVNAISLLIVNSPEGISISWKSVDGEFTMAPITKLISHSKSSWMRSKAWTDVVCFPQSPTPADYQAFTQILSDLANLVDV